MGTQERECIDIPESINASAQENDTKSNKIPTLITKEKKNNRSMLLFLLFAVILIGGGISWYYINSQPKEKDYDNTEITEESKILEEETEEEETGSKLPSLNEITWLKYTNDEIEGLSFLYPEGANVELDIQNDPRTVCINNACYKVTITYKDLIVVLDQITGIGGRGWSPDSPYTAIALNAAGDEFTYNGLLRLNDAAGMEVTYTYQPYTDGYHLPVSSKISIAKFPADQPTEYQPIADEIAASMFNTELMETYLEGTLYVDNNNSLRKLERGIESVVIENVNDESLRLTTDMHYAAFLQEKEGNNSLSIYDLFNSEFINMDALKEININDEYKWINSEEFLFVEFSGEISKYYKYNVSTNVLEKITYDEWSELIAN